MKLAPLLFVFVTSAYAVQEPPPPPPMGPVPPGLPIDNAIIFILALGLLYGVRKKWLFANSKK